MVQDGSAGGGASGAVGCLFVVAVIALGLYGCATGAYDSDPQDDSIGPTYCVELADDAGLTGKNWLDYVDDCERRLGLND